MIVTLIVLAIVLSIATAITIKFNWKQENSILTTFLSIGLLLYLFGLINIMKIAVYLIIVFSVLCLIYNVISFIKKKIKIEEIFTLGTLLYILLLIVSAALLKNTHYIEWDEFSHWGSNLKAMVSNDVFWSNKVYDGIHVVYLPLAGIIEYFFCEINGGFAENISYVATSSFIITLLLPLLRSLKYELKDILKGFLIIFSVYCLTYIFGFRIDTICVDLLVSVLFASSLMYAYFQKDKEDKTILFLLLISIVILKDMGLILAGIILMQLFFKNILFSIINEKKIQKEHLKKIGILCLILILLFTTYSTWKIYCNINGKQLDDKHDKNTIAEFDIVEYVKGVLQIGTPTEKIDSIAKSFYKALNETELITNNICKTAIQLLVFANIVTIILVVSNKKQEQKEKIISLTFAMNLGFILYCLVLMVTYMFAFTEPEGRGLASYPRYMNTYFLAWMIMLIAMISNNNKKTLTVLTITALICLSSSNILTLLHPISMTKTNVIGLEIQEKANIIEENVTADKKVYIIYQNIGDRDYFYKLRYSISPIVANLACEWNLGGPYFKGDIWTYDITEEEWKQKLREEQYDYVFIAKSDERFIKDYGAIFEEGTDLSSIENHLFTVNVKENEEVSLCLYK